MSALCSICKLPKRSKSLAKNPRPCRRCQSKRAEQIRSSIREMVRNGINIREISELLGIGYSNAEYHWARAQVLAGVHE